MRFYCASALVALAELHKGGWKAEELSGEKKYSVKDNLKKVRRIAEEKLRLDDPQAKGDL
jgi:hypothetical protein